jgi:hypothetical protein
MDAETFELSEYFSFVKFRTPGNPDPLHAGRADLSFFAIYASLRIEDWINLR